MEAAAAGRARRVPMGARAPSCSATWTWCRGASGGYSRQWRWPPTSTPCGASSPTTSGSPISSPISSTVGGFRARIRVGYGSSRGGCSKRYTGTSRRASCWISRRSRMQSSSAILVYEVNVIPRFNFPALFLERIIRSDLPVNLGALACRSENIYLGNQRNGTAKFSGAGSRFHNFRNATIDNDLISSSKFKEVPSGFGGVLASPSSELDSKWGVYGNVCRLDRPCVVDEIHLRRFDGLLEHEGAHRFVFASITVKAPVREVWNILTAYEKLPEFVPNLAISRIILRDNNKVRILQEGCKGLLYMVLHARVIMDLREKLEREISFEQVEGDFYSFKGKWRMEQLGDQHTLLKYMVETKMHKDTFLSESILEEVIYEDLPSNLCAIRDYIEKVESENGSSTIRACVLTNADTVANDYAQGMPSEKAFVSCSSSPVKQRPKVPGLQKDIEVLKSELQRFIAKYGQDGFMPKRKHLRLHGRVDIEKAITRMGGFRRIASIMNLSLSYKNRKPRGYWDNLENLQEEVIKSMFLPYCVLQGFSHEEC
ncbi:hypothetical protein GUJ93_ZPchr0003g18640 [Zizania palustris]|uniref:Coenzyme Q-binding protein COQ10 START domain-containing protein n=1 Tax=Zizania palustris TaxID=103762 RepID=A0A8J5S8J3_ZIZPA|nr:hypothetical protein GUJ93_ZPchr0003g18640 [Zizania palustris]